MFVCLLLFFFLLITRSLLLLGLYRVQSVAYIIDFIYGQSIFFKSCDCRSEGVVPANTYIEKVG